MSHLLQAQREIIGRRVRTARLSAGLSHDALGVKVGTSRQHLIKLEKGMHLPRPEMLTKIAEATGKDESFFTEDDEEDSSLPSHHDMVAVLMPSQALRRLIREEIGALA